MKGRSYTKYDYYCIQTKMGVVAGMFVLIAVSASLLVSTVAMGIQSYRQNGDLSLSSKLSLVVYALSLPMIVRMVKKYGKIQRKLREQTPEEVEKNPDFKVMIQTTKQVWGCIAAMGILAATTLALGILALWLMIAYYDSAYLILFVFCVTLTLPSLAMMIAYIRLLPITAELEKTAQSE